MSDSPSTTDPIPQDLRLIPYTPEWFASLRETLGEAACRQLGFYVIPPEWMLSVVIPVYNELDHWRALVDRVKAVPIRKEIVLVDDCSRDGTREQLQQFQLGLSSAASDPWNSFQFVYHERNRGKGQSDRGRRSTDYEQQPLAR